MAVPTDVADSNLASKRESMADRVAAVQAVRTSEDLSQLLLRHGKGWTFLRDVPKALHAHLVRPTWRPLVALCSLAEEVVRRPRARVLIGGVSPYDLEDGGRWFTMMAYLLKPQCDVQYTIAAGKVSAKPRCSRPFREVLLHKQPTILRKDFEDVCAASADTFDALVYLWPRSQPDVVRRLVSSPLLREALATGTPLLWGCYAGIERRLHQELIEAAGLRLSPWVAASPHDGEECGDDAFWARVSLSPTDTGAIDESRLAKFCATTNILSEASGSWTAFSRKVVRETLNHAGALVPSETGRQLVVSPAVRINVDTGEVQDRKPDSEDGFKTRPSRIPAALLALLPDHPTLTEEQAGYQRLRWSSEALRHLTSAPAPKGTPVSLSQRATLWNRAGEGVIHFGEATAEERATEDLAAAIGTAIAQQACCIDRQAAVATMGDALCTPFVDVQVARDSEMGTIAAHIADRRGCRQGAWTQTELLLLARKVSWRVSQYRQAADAPTPRFVAPRFLQELSRQIPLRSGLTPIRSTPVFLTNSEDREGVLTWLSDPSRRQALVLISSQTSNARHGAIQAKLARDLTGTALVVVIDEIARSAIESTWGRALAPSSNSVRLYAPALSSVSSAFDHPLWALSESGLDLATVRSVRHEVAALSVDVFESCPDDNAFPLQNKKLLVGSAHRALAREQARSADLTASLSTTTMQLSAVAERLAKVELEASEANQQTEALRKELAAVSIERDTAIHDARRAMARAVSTLPEISAENDDEGAAPTFPDHWGELEEWVARHGRGRIVLHPAAVEAARNAALRDVPLAYKALHLLADYYVPMRLRDADDVERRKAFEAKLAEYGLEHGLVGTAAESHQYKHRYKRSFGGTAVTLDLHLKKGGGFDPVTVFRLYFAWDAEKGRVLVGHLPSHLENRLTHTA